MSASSNGWQTARRATDSEALFLPGLKIKARLHGKQAAIAWLDLQLPDRGWS